MRRRIYLLSFVLVGLGCASTVPAGRLEASASAIRGAEESGAARVPQAALHLQLAREQAERAQRILAEDGDEDKAGALLLRAEMDAELARALARAAATHADAQQAIERVKSLNQANQPSP